MVFLCLLGCFPEATFLQKFLFRYYLTFSLLIVISIALLAFFYKTAARRSCRIVIITMMVLLAGTVLQLKGRSGYLSLGLLSPWIFITMFGKRRLLPVLAALLITFMLMLSSATVRERVALIPREIKLYQSGSRSSYQLSDGTLVPSSVGIRLMMWKDALKIFRDNPFVGAGTASYQYEANKIDPGMNFSHPQSSYLYVVASFGLLGIGLYSWLLFVTLRRAWRTRQQLSGYTILAFVSVILIGSLTDTQILTAATGIALGFVVGIPTPPPSLCEF
jgi:O-antigen ligase